MPETKDEPKNCGYVVFENADKLKRRMKSCEKRILRVESTLYASAGVAALLAVGWLFSSLFKALVTKPATPLAPSAVTIRNR